MDKSANETCKDQEFKKITDISSVGIKKQEKKKKKKKKKKKQSYKDMMADILKPKTTVEERLKLKKESMIMNGLGGGKFKQIETI
jgi:hypothetical protein